VIGNVLEWYDFGVYGYLVPTISQLFFPSGDPVVSLLSTFAVFGVGFVMRPVGSILFGIYGDRHGRRRALSAVVFVMALATFAMGLLPTYDQVGVLAPALLVVVRLFQGLSAGGEWGGSTAYIVEFAPSRQRGVFGSWQLVGVGGGFLLGSLTAACSMPSCRNPSVSPGDGGCPSCSASRSASLGHICVGGSTTHRNTSRSKRGALLLLLRSAKLSENTRGRPCSALA
jgi:MFS family permease